MAQSSDIMRLSSNIRRITAPSDKRLFLCLATSSGRGDRPKYNTRKGNTASRSDTVIESRSSHAQDHNHQISEVIHEVEDFEARRSTPATETRRTTTASQSRLDHHSKSPRGRERRQQSAQPSRATTEASERVVQSRQLQQPEFGSDHLSFHVSLIFTHSASFAVGLFTITTNSSIMVSAT